MFPIAALKMRSAANAPAPPPDVTTTLTPALVNSGSLIVANGAAAAWDENIREIGNIIDEGSGSQRYKMVYSGHAGAYAGNNVYVGFAYSADGSTWTKGGQLTLGAGRSSEDPYLLKVGSTYYLYVEDKADVPFRDIRCYTSTDFSTWTDQGEVLGPGTGWEATDVSSPTVWIEGATWYMLYEGRATNQEGAIGLATSSDGLTWTKSGSNPVVTGQNSTFSYAGPIKWSRTAVPDDIKKTGSTYTLHCHGGDIEFGTAYPTIVEATSLTGPWTDKTHGPVAGVNFTGDTQIQLDRSLGDGHFCYNGAAGIYAATGVARGTNIAKSTRVAANTTTGNQTITISGFGVPKAAIFTVSRAVADNTAAAHSQGSIGACDTFRQWASIHASDDAAAAVNTERAWTTTDCIKIISGSNATVFEAHFVRFVEDGVVINIDVTPGTAYFIHCTLIGGDADVYCDSTFGPTSGGTRTRNYYFETKALIAGYPGTTSAATSIANAFGYASWDGSTLNQCCYGMRNVDNADPSNVQGGVRSDGIAVALGGSNIYISVESFTSTSITMRGNAADFSGQGIGLLAIGNVSAKAGLLDSPTATGSNSFTGLGITPTAGFIIPTLCTAAGTIEATGNGGAFGFSTFNSGAEYCLSFADKDNAPTTDTQSLSDDSAINLPVEAGTSGFVAGFTSFASGQATLNFTAVPGTTRKWPSLFLG